MGRPSTGAWTVYESLRIELSYLLKHKYIVKGRVQTFTLGWTNQHGKDTGTIGIVCSYLDSDREKYVRLIYSTTARDGQKKEYDYKVLLVEVESNLGKGCVLYFECPQTFSKCRILYKAYNDDIFKSREAYKNTLYYDCQHSSKLDKYNDNYWRLDKQLDRIKKTASCGRRSYKGKLTKTARRYNRLFLKQCKMDELRWTLGVPKCLRSQIFG